VAVVIGGDQDAGSGVDRASKESARTLGVIAFILMQEGRKRKDYQVVSIGLVQKAPPIVSAIALPSSA
jgi:hypothetical protein